jgi:quinone-modifying oxidoreductase subunit QmoC
MAVFYGFLGLSAVTIWVMTARYNPLINEAFVYPLNFWDPWRILANLAGIALIAGCLMMIQERLSESDESPASTFFDWAFLGTLLAVALTGFASEALHYLRMEPHRHVIYFGHLVLVFSLLIYLPYSKFAHVFYRSTAMVFAEHTGRNKKIRVVGEE